MTQDTNIRTARCGCGQLSATCRGEADEIYACSCIACQQKSGSAFSYCAVFPQEMVSVTGERSRWRQTSESGRWVERCFCPACGTTVYFSYEGRPGFLGVSAGCFGDPDFAKPATLYWASRRHSWLHWPHDTIMIDTQPRGEDS